MWLLVVGVMIASSGRPLVHSCPIELSPSSLVVRFGDAVSVNCSTAVEDYQTMGWEVPQGAASSAGEAFVTWSLPSLNTWSIKPSCYITVSGYEDQCQLPLKVTVYKTPDNVSVSELTAAGPMQVGGTYQLQCNVINIAPSWNISVVWYRGNYIIHTEALDIDMATPQNESFNLTINPEKSHHGVPIRCLVQQDLGSSGPAATWSEPYVLQVTYPPSFISPQPETFDLAEVAQPVLNCSADGNPLPTYQWRSSAKGQDLGNQSVSSPLLPGTYNCTASNQLASMKKVFIVKRSSTGNPGTTAGIVLGALVLGALVLLACVAYVYRRSAKTYFVSRPR